MEKCRIQQKDLLTPFNLEDLNFGTTNDLSDMKEAKLGGDIHSKGVLIMSGFIAGRYLPQQPLSMLASLVFEQSYAEAEGDSASSAELYALLSALAQVPVRQWIAVTGSVNQYGQVQAVGGVNQKIEGFFDVCKKRGLTGKQGVLCNREQKHSAVTLGCIPTAIQTQYPIE